MQRGGGVQTSKKLLAALAVMAVAFVVLAAVPSVAVDSDAVETTPVDVDSIDKLTGNTAGTYKLKADLEVTSSIEISAKITLDLNGYKITAIGAHTIVVKSAGDLTVIDSSADANKKGTVDVKNTGYGALFIETGGKATLNGGLFERSGETATKIDGKEPANKDSWYTIKNLGSLTINEGTIIKNYVPGTDVDVTKITGASSNICNGGDGATSSATLLIDGGTIDGGLNAVKNDKYGVLTIKAGTITNQIQVAVMNWGEATIDGGSFTGYQSALWVCSWKDDDSSTASAGELTVNGGVFTNSNGQPDLVVQTNSIYNDDSKTYADQPVAVILGKAVELTVKCNNTEAGFVLSEGSSLEFVKDSVLPKTVSYTKDSKISSVEFSGATAGDVVKISAGSIDISGQINAATSGTITVTGDAVISESAILSNGVTLTIQDGATLTVKNGATLTVAEGATITDSNTETKFVNNGTVIVKGTVDKIDNKKTVRLYGEITGGTNDGTIVVMDKDAVVENIAGTGTIDVSEVTKTKKISGTITQGYTNSPSFQTIVVFEDLVIEEGALVDVYGSFVINEGVKVTIEAGAALRLSGSMAKLVNNGTIIVNGEKVVSDNVITIEGKSADSALDIDAYASVENNGSIQLDYVLPSNETALGASMHVAENAIVSNTGEIVVGEASKLDVDGKLVSSGTLSVKGQFQGVVSNSGIVEFDSVLAQAATVSLTSAVASVSLVKVVGNVTVNDIGFKYKATTSSEATEITAADAQSVAVSYIQPENDSSAYIGGLTIVIGTFVKDVESNGKTVKTTFTEIVLSGSVARSVTGSDPASGVPAGDVDIVGPAEVKDSLTVGTHVDVSVEGEFKVTGTAVFGQNAVLMSKDSSNKGILVAVGEVTSAVDFLNDSDITSKIDFVGATYKVKVQATATASESTTYRYAGIAAAIDAAAKASVKAVDIYAETDGTSLTEDAVVVKDMTVTLVQGKLVIDSGKTLEVADGGVLKSESGKKIQVDGKLVFDVAKTGKKIADEDILAEVVSTVDKSETYSSLVTALADAGSETTVIKLRSNATIKADTAIQSNVTVQTEGNSITVDKEKTLTVDGTIYLNTGSIVLGDDKAKVVLNGYIKSDNSYVYETNEIDGAYYTTDDQTYYWATGIANAPAVTSKADAAVKIFGDVTTALDFVGTADDLAVVEITAKKISAPISGTYTKIAVKTGTVTGAFALADSEVVFENGVVLGTSVKAGDDSVAMKDLDSSGATFVAAAKDGAQVLSVTGTIVASPAEDAAPSISFTGDVTATGFNAKVKAAVDGNLTVSKNVVLGDVVVAGTVLIDNASKLTVDDMQIDGTVTVAAKTDTKNAGALEAKKIFLGTTEKSVLGAEPAIVASDKITFDVMYVAPGASVSDAAVKDVEKTVYTVENAVVLTAYGDAKIADYKYKVVDARFDGWYNGTTKVENQMIGDFDTVAAKMVYEVYEIHIVGDAGVGTVSVNGIILDKDRNSSNGFCTRSDVKAGTYKVTFTAVSGYDTSALKLTDASGKDLSMEIVLSGDYKESYDTVYYLSGSVPAVTPTPDPTPIIIKDEDDGMSLTDILLIVLVVLIVIMAAIVALRMMRS